MVPRRKENQPHLNPMRCVLEYYLQGKALTLAFITVEKYYIVSSGRENFGCVELRETVVFQTMQLIQKEEQDLEESSR